MEWLSVTTAADGPGTEMTAPGTLSTEVTSSVGIAGAPSPGLLMLVPDSVSGVCVCHHLLRVIPTSRRSIAASWARETPAAAAGCRTSRW